MRRLHLCLQKRLADCDAVIEGSPHAEALRCILRIIDRMPEHIRELYAGCNIRHDTYRELAAIIREAMPSLQYEIDDAEFNRLVIEAIHKP